MKKNIIVIIVCLLFSFCSLVTPIVAYTSDNPFSFTPYHSSLSFYSDGEKVYFQGVGLIDGYVGHGFQTSVSEIRWSTKEGSGSLLLDTSDGDHYLYYVVIKEEGDSPERVLSIPYRCQNNKAIFPDYTVKPYNDNQLAVLSQSDSRLNQSIMTRDPISGISYSELNRFAQQLCLNAQSDIEKAQRIHEFITSSIAYNFEAKFNYQQFLLSSNPLWVFNNRRGICSGISKLATIMFRAVNIPCVSVVGVLQDSMVNFDNGQYNNHEWNAIYIDGVWSFCDFTIDCNNRYEYNQSGVYSYVFNPNSNAYFMKSSDVFSLTHASREVLGTFDGLYNVRYFVKQTIDGYWEVVHQERIVDLNNTIACLAIDGYRCKGWHQERIDYSYDVDMYAQYEPYVENDEYHEIAKYYFLMMYPLRQVRFTTMEGIKHVEWLQHAGFVVNNDSLTVMLDKNNSQSSRVLSGIITFNDNRKELPFTINCQIIDEYIRGDCNHDDHLSVMDLTIINNHILNVSLLSDESFAKADINGDGIISVVDCLMASHLILTNGS